jgi:glycosyltransferase involved in cell wall biosynthesis
MPVHVIVLNPVRADSFGGAERVLLEFLSRLDRERYRPIVIVSGDGKFSRAVKDIDIEVEAIPVLTGTPAINPNQLDYFLFILRCLMGIPFLIAKLLRFPASLVHTNSRGGHIAGGIAAKILGLPVVMHFQDHPSHAKFYNWLSAYFAHRVIAASRATEDWLTQGRWSLASKIQVIHAGVDTVCFHPEANGENLKELLGIEKSCFPIIITVGTLEPRKGQLDIIRAIAIVRDTYPNLRLLIVGQELVPNSYFPLLQSQTIDNRLEEQVVFLGWREDIPQLMAASDIMALATLRDPYPTVVLEAMAAGLPVITTRAGGSIEIVREGSTGLLVQFNDHQEMAQALLLLAANPERMRAMGRAGRQQVERYASLKTFADALQHVYQQVLEV